MQCDYFDDGRCRSCTLMGVRYADQLADKDRAVRASLQGVAADAEWLLPFASAESGFRNKAKLAVGGTIEQPTLGILDHGAGIDLRHCGLYEPALGAVLPRVADFVTEASLAPYDLATRRGELKNLLLTISPAGRIMLRFVLRSQESIARIRKHLPALRGDLPQIEVVSANIHPEHKAVLEGHHEICLSDQRTLAMPLGDVTLHLRPQSFFQTNTAVATGLYAQAQQWVRSIDARTLWDLYCGVGGFALHLAAPDREIVGVESSAEAVTSAALSAHDRPGTLEFVAGDAGVFVECNEPPQLVVVNPPRRGIGDIADWLERSMVRTVLYSSCNAESLARDLARMPSLSPVRARMFDMFPQTAHHEVLMLLERR